MAGAGEHHHQPLAPVLEPKEVHEPATTSYQPSQLALMADGVEVAGAGEHLHQPLAHVLEPGGERRSSGEILPEKEQDSLLAPALPTASVCMDGRQENASEHLDVESGDVTANLPIVTSANNRGILLCGWATLPNCAKWVYAAFFLGGIVLAISSRDMEVSPISRPEQGNGCEHDRNCVGAENALRISLAFFAFFAIMFITTVRTKKVQECGNLWNSNLGVPLIIKVSLVVGCLYLVPLIPSPFIQFYGNVARFGAWLYLAIQLISVTKFIVWLNKWHQSNPERRSSCKRWLVKATAIILNFGSFGVTFWLLHEHKSNILDFIIASVTLVLIVLMILIYLKSKNQVRAGWLAHGLMIAYVVFTCWSVIRSEPHRNFTKAKHPKGADWLTITSFVFVVIVTAYSTISTGEDHEWLQFNEEVPSDDDIPYGFGYFHLVLSLGSMYFGMLLVAWNANQTMQRWTIDFGWWSAVVRGVNGILAAMLYIWMLRTPFIWSKRKLVLSWSGASFLPHVRFL